MLNLKQVADDILTVIAGSSAFPTNTALGGFIVPPQIDKLSAIKEQIYDVLDEAEDLVKLFSELTYPKVETSLKFLTIASPKIKYPLYQSKTPAKIKEIIFNESTSKLGVLPNGETVKVGALARLASASARLNPMARRLFEKYAPNVNNPFSNNLAQAIETLHFLETSIKLIEHLEQGDLLQSAIQQPQKITRQQKGIASLEAPRGTLTHEILLNPDLTVARYNIIPPTQINLAALRVEADAFLAQNKNLSEEQTKRELEKLIRAFDPCITCAVH
jgi:sulfhydrogenase subunit alpha